MTFASDEEFSAWLTGILNERMRKNAEGMIADGWTEEEIKARQPEWQAEVERCHRYAMACMRRIVSAPDAPSHELQ